MDQRYPIKSANGAANNGAKTTTLLACPTNGKIFLVGGGISVTVAAVGGGGLVQLVEVQTGNILFSASTNAQQYYPIYFGETGLPLTNGNDLQLKVTGAVTTDGTVMAAFLAYTAS